MRVDQSRRFQRRLQVALTNRSLDVLLRVTRYAMINPVLVVPNRSTS